MFSVLRQFVSGARLRVTTSLGIGSLGREDVHELVHRVARMSLHPREAHVTFLIENQREELLHKSRLATGWPWSSSSPDEAIRRALVVEALHDVRGVAHDLERTLFVLAQASMTAITSMR